MVLPLTGAGPSAGGESYAEKVLGIQPANLVAYWPLWEAEGAVANDISGNGFHGAYTGVTLGQTGIGDGRTCPLFDGASGYVNIYTEALQTLFNSGGLGAEGSCIIWAKVFNSGVWTDGNWRSAFMCEQGWDTNRIAFLRANSDNVLNWHYVANGTFDNPAKSSMSELDWMCLGFTWSKTADKVIAYYNGAQEGATETGLGTWNGGILLNHMNIGAGLTGTELWYGWLAHVILLDAPLSATKMLSLATV